MNTVWKFPLPSAHCVIRMPYGARVVRVGTQDGEICVWALVNTDNAHEERLFACIFTGESIPPSSRYLGTFELNRLVFHAFEPEEFAPR